MNRIDVIKSVARNLRDLVVDTIPATLSTTQISADRLIHPETNQLRGYPIYLYDGGGLGQDNIVASFDASNNRMGFDRAFSTSPSTNTDFIVTRFWEKSEYDNALDRIIGVARQFNLEERIATMQLVGSQYEYAVPSGFEYISNIRLVPSGNTAYQQEDKVSRIFELPPRYWSIEPNAGGTMLIVFDPRKVDILSFDKNWVKVVGQSKPDITATDNATIPQNLEEYVVSGASELLAMQRISESNEWRIKFQAFRDVRKTQEPFIHSVRYGKRVGG